MLENKKIFANRTTFSLVIILIILICLFVVFWFQCRNEKIVQRPVDDNQLSQVPVFENYFTAEKLEPVKIGLQTININKPSHLFNYIQGKIEIAVDGILTSTHNGHYIYPGIQISSENQSQPSQPSQSYHLVLDPTEWESLQPHVGRSAFITGYLQLSNPKYIFVQSISIPSRAQKGPPK